MIRECKVCGELLVEVVDRVPYGNTMLAMTSYYCVNDCDEEAFEQACEACQECFINGEECDEYCLSDDEFICPKNY